jgi:hypothetical protein
MSETGVRDVLGDGPGADDGVITGLDEVCDVSDDVL